MLPRERRIMIGYYVHHVGTGHLRHARCIAAASGQELTALSSLPRPDDWTGPWIQLDRDDSAERPVDPTGHGRLHWSPLHDRGLSARMRTIARWLDTAAPAVLVVDVSVEVSVFARLMGVPVVVMGLPGKRSDAAHQLGYSVAELILAPWPPGLAAMDRDLQPWAQRTAHVGGLSPFEGRSRHPHDRASSRRVVVLQGRGGTSVSESTVRSAADAAPGWSWQRLGPGAWCADPWPALSSANVVICHAGLGALADVAAAGCPAIVLPEPRPHGEQYATADALRTAGLATVLTSWPRPHEWSELLARAARTPASRWSSWCRSGAARAARLIDDVGSGAGREQEQCASR
ncbi:hypothetical protein M6B22_09225 [Jatrophihabitans cynanchi]|uniref:Glycosyl transferase family 28 C-terminal domain-containing protein n=1 Tax=Jatrophihabitans cynanchi TaxID=2944128 RepID=A0ABY7K2K1_9ACTN|nr:glycosyltransferase [Jatrophihabitans sp. SB3-54]WAX58924.1 hypothetical protein M6B22_09225 [Jatrophihabitans sp. SB3-54]